VAALALAALAWPAVAGAHGSFDRAYLPVPTWLFAWAAGAVLAVDRAAARARPGRIGLVGAAALELTFTLGLLACVLLCAGLYGLGVRAMSSVSADHPTRELARRFIHSLAPIAFGYGR
jgi:hypothetical protein